LPFGMLAAIDLDDELCFRTKEIDDVPSDRLLSAEAEALNLLAPEA